MASLGQETARAREDRALHPQGYQFGRKSPRVDDTAHAD